MYKARLAHFYGWSDNYIGKLSMGKATDYYNAITVIEAQENLVKMNIADYPNMKKDSRRKLHKGMYKLASPKHLQKEMSFEEFQEKMLGNRNR